MTTSPVVTITEEMVAELEALADNARFYDWAPDIWMSTDETVYACCASPQTILALLAERAAMQSQIKAGIVTQDNLELYRKDAERYQWLRERQFSFSHDEAERGISTMRWGEWHYDTPEGHAAQLDAAIDQAMQEQQP